MYGITNKDKKKIDKKIEYQKEFLQSFSIEVGDKFHSMLDSCYSANLNPNKYFAEMNNRVNSIFEYTKSENLKPVFITLTAPARFHKKNKKGKLIVDPSDTAKELSKIWAKFLRLKIFKHMKSDTGHNLIYFRVYEPHKSGVPHMHAMLFLPNEYILKVKKRFYNYFNDFGTNKKAIDFKYTFYDKDNKGYSTGGAIAYIIKYITKTFTNEDSNINNDAVYWYVKHRIRRFLSSRTLAPLILYRKIRHDFKNMENDYLYITKKYQIGQIQRLFNDTVFTINRFNTDTEDYEDIILYKKMILDPENPTSEAKEKAYLKYFALKLGRIFGKEFLEINYSQLMPNYYVNYINDDENELESIDEILFQILSDKEYDEKFARKEKQIDRKDYDYRGFDCYKPNRSNSFNGLTIVPARLKDMQLLNYHKKLQLAKLEDLDMKHYGVVENEIKKLIRRRNNIFKLL